MSIEQLYSQVLLDHSIHPRHFGEIEDADVTLEGANPLCGDEIKLFVKADSEKINHISFSGHSCAICKA